MESYGGMILTGKTEELGEKTCSSVTIPTTNPTWSDQDANPNFRDERQATNRLSHGRAISLLTYSLYQPFLNTQFYKHFMLGFYLFIFGLFNYAVCSSYFIASDGRMCIVNNKL
jgi:hypothetical protein